MTLSYDKAANTGRYGGNDGAENDDWNHDGINTDGTVFHLCYF